MKNYFFILIASVLLLDCHSKKKKIEPTCEYCATGCEHYATGDLLVGTKESTSLQAAFDLANQSGFLIKKVSLQYIVDLPEDSIPALVDYLNKKSYINTSGWSMSTSTITGKVVFFATLFTMDKANQNDWQETISVKGLTEMSIVKTMYLKVPVGGEKFWAHNWSQNPIIKWAELNCIMTTVPIGS